MIRKTWTLDPVTYNVLKTAARMDGYKNESSLVRKILNEWSQKWSAKTGEEEQDD